MKLISVEFGQVTWIFDLVVQGGNVYAPEALTAIKDRYKFVTVPSLETVLSQQSNFVFEHGKFVDSVIRKFSTHNDGMVAETSAGTNNAEEFLDDFVKWSCEKFGATVLEINDAYRVYDSHLIVQMEIDLEEKMAFIKFINDELSSEIKNYGIIPLDYHASGFSLSTDSAEVRGLSTSSFRIDRRIGQRFSNNLYYCTAPLKTADHIRLLGKIENLI